MNGSDLPREARPWVERGARAGYTAKGVVYVVIGILALRAAWDMGVETSPDSKGVFRTILSQPFGEAILVVVGLGLLAYALWRFVESLFDPNSGGESRPGHRAAYAVSGVVHVALAVQAIRMALGNGSSGGDSPDEKTAGLMAQPFGVFLVGLVALGIAGYGVYELSKAWRGKVTKRLDLSGFDAQQRRWIERLSNFGTAARGVVFVMIGGFLMKAAVEHDPSEARDLAGALRELEQASYGPWIVTAVAAGLALYGVTMFLKARYRRLM